MDGVACEAKWLLPNNVLCIARHRYQAAYTPRAEGPPPDAEEHPFARSLLEKAGLVSHKEQEELPRPQLRRRADPDVPRERWTLDDDA